MEAFLYREPPAIVNPAPADTINQEGTFNLQNQAQLPDLAPILTRPLHYPINQKLLPGGRMQVDLKQKTQSEISQEIAPIILRTLQGLQLGFAPGYINGLSDQIASQVLFLTSQPDASRYSDITQLITGNSNYQSFVIYVSLNTAVFSDGRRYVSYSIRIGYTLKNMTPQYTRTLRPLWIAGNTASSDTTCTSPYVPTPAINQETATVPNSLPVIQKLAQQQSATD